MHVAHGAVSSPQLLQLQPPLPLLPQRYPHNEGAFLTFGSQPQQHHQPAKLNAWDTSWWKAIRQAPPPGPRELSPPLAALHMALQSWDSAQGLQPPQGLDGFGSSLRLPSAQGSVDQMPQRSAALAPATLSPPLVYDGVSRLLASAPRAVESVRPDSVDLEWVVKESCMSYGHIPNTVECVLEQVHLHSPECPGLSEPCKFLPGDVPMIVSAAVESSLWRARVVNLRLHGESYQFRATPRAADGASGWWDVAGPWSVTYSTPSTPSVASRPLAEAVPDLSLLAAGYDASGVDSSVGYIRLSWNTYESTGDDPHQPIQCSILGCEVQQRATGGQDMRGPGTSESGSCCFRMRPTILDLPQDVVGAVPWGCVAEVTAAPKTDALGRLHVLRFQFRVRAVNAVGGGPWSAWSDPVCNLRVAAEKQALRVRSTPGRRQL